MTFLAATAHSHGLAAGLKNALELLPESTAKVDFAVNEECLQYDECDAYADFLATGRAVFHIEYEGSPSTVCPHVPSGFSTVIGRLDLADSTLPCPADPS